MSNETNKNYEYVERPYNTYLERSDLSVGEDTSQGQSSTSNDPSSGNVVTDNKQGTEDSANNGSVETQPVKSDGGMADVWIRNFIKSDNWKPKKVGFYIDGQTGYAEFTNVYVSGDIQALTGHIGGWIIGGTSLTDVSGVTGMSSAVTAGDDIRFWAGDANPLIAEFRVTESGALYASSATITGAITATSGTIGSFTIGTYLYTGNKVAYNDVEAGVHIGGDGIGIANNLFTVSAAGVITAVSGTIGGCTLATTSIGSTTFVSGPLGSGWNISNTGVAEFQNVTIRGSIRTSVFEKDTVSAINGIVMVTKSDILSLDMTALDASTLTIKGDTAFVINEVIQIKDGVDEEFLLVTGVASAPTYNVTRDLNSAYPVNTNPIWKKGTAVVSTGVGTGTKTGYIALDSSSSNSPFIDIYGRNSNTYTDVTLHARLGWLKGITDADVELATTDVWGLYTDNAYIKGTIVANLGYIGGTTGWTIASGYLKKDTGVELTSAGMAPLDWPFYAGAQYANRATAPFRVSNAGVLNATGVTVSGVITADTGYIGGASGWTIAATKIYGGSGSAFSGMIQGTGVTKSFFAGATDNVGANAKFYVTAAGDLVATSATISGYKLFEAIVAPSGGDYTTVSAALLAGKTRIFVRNGTYSSEPRWAIATSGTTIVGESKAGVIISFAKDTTQTDVTSGYCKSISIPTGKNNCTFNSLTLNSYDFSGDSIMYDFWNFTILNTTNWTETDPDGALSYSSSYLEIANPHAVAAKSLFTDKMQSKLSIASGIVSAQSYIFQNTPSAAEAQGGMYLYVDANNYAAIVTNGSAGGNEMKYIIVKGGAEVYSHTPGVAPSNTFKITYNITTRAIDFFVWDGGTVWWSSDGPQVQNIGGPVYFVASSSDSNAQTGADVIYLKNTFLTNTDYATQYPVISQDLFNTASSYHKIDNCLMQAKRGYILNGGYYCVVRDSYIDQNTILYMGNNSGEPITGSFLYMEYNSIENVVIDMSTLNIGTSVPVILGQSNYCSFFGCKLFSGVNGQSWSVTSSTTTVFNSCVLTFQQLDVSVNIVNCELKNNGYSPASYFITLGSGRFVGNRIKCKDKADDIMLINGSSCLVQNNIFDTGKKVYIHNASITIKGVLFENNNWFSPYTTAAIDLQIGTATDTIVMGNAIRCNTGGGSTPTITDGGTSSTVQYNELING